MRTSIKEKSGNFAGLEHLGVGRVSGSFYKQFKVIIYKLENLLFSNVTLKTFAERSQQIAVVGPFVAQSYISDSTHVASHVKCVTV